ncbi:hypothetical protein AS035_17240 [Bacillus altitudinis]|nr:hypothetical protein AS035_17240 [Bacillus altitudinis]
MKMIINFIYVKSYRVHSTKGALSYMSKKKIKTYQQLIEENKEAIMRDPKMMESIYATIDKKHQKQLAAAGRKS